MFHSQLALRQPGLRAERISVRSLRLRDLLIHRHAGSRLAAHGPGERLGRQLC